MNDQETSDISVKKTSNDILRELFEWAESIFAAMIMVVVILTFIARTSVVDGNSMLPTLVNEEFLIISSFIEEYKHNDIIVLWANNYTGVGFESGKALVKRVVGTPGDVIEVDFENGIVYRNGTALETTETGGVIYEDGHMINDYTTSAYDMKGPVTVPEGYVFVLGDNRNYSMDSRNGIIGLVDSHFIIGKALFRLFPLDRIGSVYG